MQISPSDVNFMDPTRLMESLNLYPPRFTIRVHGEEAKCTTIAQLAFKGCRESINMETVLPLRRKGKDGSKSVVEFEFLGHEK